ncbi:MAG: FmdB family zinc ribbon protein [Candidatus Binatia bacterium]
MPTYEFLCQKCKKTFAEVCSVTQYVQRKKRGIKCPKCGSSKVDQQISAFQVQTSKKS